ncbi:MAG TPA: protein translocase subunit SecF [Acidimicrobiales bacterium]|nr:protein translocase subunit SecF [Acidimicrobiales bacterium]
MTAVTDGAPPRHGLWHRLYHGETAYDFVGRKRLWFLISGAIILIGVVALIVRPGLNLSIDFKGGTSWEVKAPGVTVAHAESAVSSAGVPDAQVQIFGKDDLHVAANIKGAGGAANTVTEAAVTQKLARLAHTNTSAVSINDVGPSWGSDITRKAEYALGFFLLTIIIYLSVRFEPKMALAAIVAVLHDILVTVGVYALFGFQVSPDTVVAFLTILGYSLYDTVVVFDKVQENARGIGSTGRLTYSETVNLSMNQVLMRSINTSLVAILPIIAVLVIAVYLLGASTLQSFGLALFIGLLSGAYSSIFIASPLLAILKEREPRYATIRQRLATRAAQAPLTPAAAAAGAGAGGGGQPTPTITPRGDGRPPTRPGPPRPGARRPPPRGRKKGRRR